MMSETALAVTVKSTELSIDLKGFDALRSQVAQHIEAQKTLLVKITSHGLETGRLIVEFASKKDVRLEVDRRNKEKQEKGEGGRPTAYHCYVAKLLSDSGIGVSKEWLEKCARAFERSKALGFKVKNVNLLSVQTTEKESVQTLALPGGNVTVHTPPQQDDSTYPVPIEDVLPAPDRVFPPEAVKKETPPPPTFKDFVHSSIAKLESFSAHAGEIGLRRKKNQEEWADAISAWWQAQGIAVDITFN